MANVVEIVIKQTAQGNAITEVTKSLGGIKGAGDTAISTLLGVGKALAGVGAVATTALVGFGVSGVKAAMDVDHQLAQIAATMGVTKEAALPLKQLMTDLALDPNLTVNATQAGQAIEVLAANGLAMDEIMGGAARSTVQLANATGSDFGTAATIATDAMQQFNIEGENLGVVADGIAGVLVQSKLSADDYALALSNAGGVFGGLGGDITDFNTILAATAPLFSSGADAGTSLKTLMTRLAEPTNEVKEAMDAYGISIFDNEGKMRSWGEIAGQLNKVFNESFTVTTQVGGATKEQAAAAEQASAKIGDLSRDIGLNKDKLKLLNDELALQIQYYGDGSPKVRQKQIAIQKLTNTITDQEEKLAGYQSAINAVEGAQARTVTSTKQLTEAEKAQLATILGGTDAMRTILGLAEMSEEEFNALSGEVNKSGLASQAAATRVDSLAGAWEIFKGIIEAVQIQVGDKFLPLVRRVTEAVSVWASENSDSIVNFFGQIAGGVDGVITAVSKIVGAFQRFGIEGAARSLLGQLGFSPEQVKVITDTIDELITNIKTILSSGLGSMAGLTSVMNIGAMLGLDPETTANILTTINTIITTISSFASQVSSLISGISFDAWLGALAGVGAVLAGGVLVSLVAGLLALLTPINLLIAGAALLGAAWAGNWFGIQETTAQAISTLTPIFTGLQAIIMSLVNTLVANVWPQLQEAFANITAALNNMGLTWGDVWNALVTATTVVASVLGVAILGIIGTVAGLVTGFASAFATVTSYFTDFQNAIATFVSGISQLFTGMITITSGFLIGDLGMIFKGVEQAVSGLFDTLGGLGDFLITALQASLGAVLSFSKGWMSSFLGFFDGLAPAMGGKFEEVWEAIREVWKPDIWIELGASIITGILEGIKTNQAEVLEMLKSLMADAIQAAKDSIGFGSPAKEFMPLGESMIQGMLVGAESQKFAKNFIDGLQMGGIARQLGGGGSGWKEMRRHIHGGIKANFQELMTSGLSPAQIITKIQETAAKFNFPPSFASEFAQANGLIEHLNSSAKEFQKVMRLENMGRMVQIGGQLSALGQGFADMLKEPMDKNAERIKLFKDFIEKTAPTGSGRTGAAANLQTMLEFEQDGLKVAMNRTLVQKELNRLLAEQTHQQELITKQQEAQQKIGFLQQQIELIKMGKELGGNIFQGIQFGLDASVEDLLAATNAVTMAMIDQINSDLQIASPSKLLYKMFKDNVGGAMAGGLLAAKPMMQSAIQPVLNPVMNAASAAGKVVNNYFNQTVNTQADQSSVIGDFRAMQLMAG